MFNFIRRSLDGLLDRSILLEAKALKLFTKAGGGGLELRDFIERPLYSLLDCGIFFKSHAFQFIAQYNYGVAQVPKDRVMSGLREEMRGPPQHWIKPGEPDPVEEHRVGGLAKIK